MMWVLWLLRLFLINILLLLMLLLLGFTFIVDDSLLFLLLSRLGWLRLLLLNLHIGVSLRVKHQYRLVLRGFLQLLLSVIRGLLLNHHLVLSIWSCLDVILLRSFLLDDSHLIRLSGARWGHVHLWDLALRGRMWDNCNFIDSLIRLISLGMWVSGWNYLSGLLSVAIDDLLMLRLL